MIILEDSGRFWKILEVARHLSIVIKYDPLLYTDAAGMRGHLQMYEQFCQRGSARWLKASLALKKEDRSATAS